MRLKVVIGRGHTPAGGPEDRIDPSCGTDTVPPSPLYFRNRCCKSCRCSPTATDRPTWTCCSLHSLLLKLLLSSLLGETDVCDEIAEPQGNKQVTVYFNLVLLVWGCLGWLSCIILIAGIYSLTYCYSYMFLTINYKRLADVFHYQQNGVITIQSLKLNPGKCRAMINKNDTKYLLIPWVFIVSGMMLLDFSHTMFLLFTGSTSFEPLTAILFTLDFFNSSLQTYSVLCVVSLYQEYKAGRGTADFEYVNRRVPGVRYAPQPTGTSFLSTRRAVTYHETRASPTGSPPQDVRSSSRKHVQFGDDRTWLAPPPPSVIHIESPKACKLRPNRTSSNSTRSSNVSFESAASGEIFPAKGENVPPISPVSLESTIQETQSGEWSSHVDSTCDPTCDTYNYHVDTDLTHDSVSSDLNGRSGASPSEEGNSSGEWPGVKAVVDTQPLIGHVKSASQMSI